MTRVDSQGVGIEVADDGAGRAVLLLHGWPDSGNLWRRQVEALTGAGIALLTVYDMAKALDKGMVVSDISLAAKVGGKGGDYARLDGMGDAP